MELTLKISDQKLVHAAVGAIAKLLVEAAWDTEVKREMTTKEEEVIIPIEAFEDDSAILGTETEQEPVRMYTLQDLQKRLGELSKAKKPIKKLINDFGANTLSEIKEEDYVKLMEAAEKL